MDSLREIQRKFLSSAASTGKSHLKTMACVLPEKPISHFHTGFHLQNVLFKMWRPNLAPQGHSMKQQATEQAIRKKTNSQIIVSYVLQYEIFINRNIKYLYLNI